MATISNILKSIFKAPRFFLVTWVIVIIANQLFIFRGCFAVYCLLAALPHTSVIAGLITYFYRKDKSKENVKSSATLNPPATQKEKDNGIKCPNCGSPMIIRKAQRGRFAGSEFFGCSKYPQCKGIVNIE